MKQLGKPGVVTVGSINIDLVVKAQRRPQAGETFTGDTFAIYAGGKGANQAVQAALSGAASYMVARAGADVFLPLVTDLFDRVGVDRTFVIEDPAGSGIGHVVVDAAGDYSTIIVAQANGNLEPDDVDRAHAAFAASRILLLQLESPLRAVEHAAAKASAMGLRVCLNVAPALAVPNALLDNVDLLVVNAIEAQMMLGTARAIEGLAAVKAAATDLAAGRREVVVTLGERGCVALDSSGDFRVLDGYHVPVVNTIGAGDAFVGELAARLADGLSLAAALPYANAAGAVACTRHEPQGVTPERDRIEELLRRRPAA